MVPQKVFFSNFNFWTTLFSKIMPNFWQTGAPRILKIQCFPLSILIFGQKSCFLGPTIFKIQQPNWYYTDSNQKKGVAIQKKNWHSNICQNLSIGKDIWLLFVKETKTLAQSWVLSLSKLNLRGLDHLDPGSM